MPFLSRTTPAASKTSPISRISSSLAMLQVLVANQLDALCVNLCPHARADERIKFISKFIERGMRVKLGITGRKPRQQLRDVGFIDPLILQQPKDCASMADASTFEPGPRARREAMVNECVHRAITPMPGRETYIEPKRVEGEPETLDAQLGCVLHQDAEDRRVQVQVQVPAHMIQ